MSHAHFHHVGSRGHHFAPHAGPFASPVGVGRAEKEWADLNKVTDIMGSDAIEAFETSIGAPKTEGPVKLDAVSCELP